jgi:hypothetical protein
VLPGWREPAAIFSQALSRPRCRDDFCVGYVGFLDPYGIALLEFDHGIRRVEKHGSCGSCHFRNLGRSARFGRRRNISASHLMKRIKRKSSRKLLQQFSQLNKECWGQHLWSRGFFVASSGVVRDEAIIESSVCPN